MARELLPRRHSALVASSVLGRLIDRLLQTFENCRSGLSDAALGGGEVAVEQYFMEVYEREQARLEETIRDQPLLDADARDALRRDVDAHIRKVVIPSYARHATKFTRRERNDFYLTEDKFHALERIGFGVAGILVGLFVIAAPFIPLWSKEWVLPFMIAGLLLPNLRRYFALRRYEKELNRLVLGADRELSRIEVAYLSSSEPIEEEKQRAEDEDRRRRLAARNAQRDKEN